MTHQSPELRAPAAPSFGASIQERLEKGRATLERVASLLAIIALALIPFFREWRIFGAHMTSTQVLLSVAVGCWFVSRLPLRLTRLPIFFPAATFLAICALGVLHAEDTKSVARETLQLVWLLGVYWMYADMLVDRAFLEKGAKLAMAAAPVAAVVGLVGYWMVNEPHGAIHANRARASMPFGQPNVYGSYLVAFVPLGVALFVTSRRRIERLLSGLALLIVAFGLYASYSRAAWLGALAGTGLFAAAFIRIDRIWKLLAPAAIVATGLALCVVDISTSRPTPGSRALALKQDELARQAAAATASPSTTNVELGAPTADSPAQPKPVVAEKAEPQPVAPRPTRLPDHYVKSTSKHETDGERLLLIKAALNMWKDHKLLGIGLGNYRHHLPDYVGHGYRRNLDNRHEFVHLLPLHILTELGLVGVAVAIWLVVSILLAAWRTLRGVGGNERILRLGMACGALAVFSCGMLGWPFIRGPQEALAFMAGGSALLTAVSVRSAFGRQ